MMAEHNKAAKALKAASSKPPLNVLPYQTPMLKEHYTLGKKLGHGQFGTTYVCTERATGLEYACKSIPKKKLLCREDYEDVWREIQIMHHLSENPHVVSIKGTYEDDTTVHLLMEVCRGGELFDRIVSKGHFSERKAAELMKTIVGVVEGCHSLGVMHRDLKPENFLFDTPDEDAKLKATDFGLSVFYKPGQYLSDVVGSPYYVAPEVLHKFYGPEIDVWSAGVILYILLCGVPPFWAGIHNSFQFLLNVSHHWPDHLPHPISAARQTNPRKIPVAELLQRVSPTIAAARVLQEIVVHQWSLSVTQIVDLPPRHSLSQRSPSPFARGWRLGVATAGARVNRCFLREIL